MDPVARADLHDSLAYVVWARGSCLGTRDLHRRGGARRRRWTRPGREAPLARTDEFSIRFELDRPRELAERAWSLAVGRSGADRPTPERAVPGRPLLTADRRGDRRRPARCRNRATDTITGRRGAAARLRRLPRCLEEYQPGGAAGRARHRRLPGRAGLVALIPALTVLFGPRAPTGSARHAQARPGPRPFCGQGARSDPRGSWALARAGSAEACSGATTECRAHAEEAIERGAGPADTEVEAHALEALGRLELGRGAPESIAHSKGPRTWPEAPEAGPRTSSGARI